MPFLRAVIHDGLKKNPVRGVLPKVGENRRTGAMGRACSTDPAVFVAESCNGFAKKRFRDLLVGFKGCGAGGMASGNGLDAVECEESLLDMLFATGAHHPADFKCHFHVLPIG